MEAPAAGLANENPLNGEEVAGVEEGGATGGGLEDAPNVNEGVCDEPVDDAADVEPNEKLEVGFGLAEDAPPKENDPKGVDDGAVGAGAEVCWHC